MDEDQLRRIAQADEELEDAMARLETELQQQHPEMFDRDGRAPSTVLAQLLRSRLGAQGLTQRSIRALLARKRAARSLRAS